MKKFFIVLVSFFIVMLHLGCGSGGDTSGDTSTVSNTSNDTSTVSDVTTPSYADNYTQTVADDTSEVDNLAVVPHHKNSIATLVVLVEYDNQPLQTTPQAWHDKIFGNDEAQLNNYYKEVSRGKFQLVAVHENSGENDGIVQVHLNKNHIDTDLDSPYFLQKFAADTKEAIAKCDDFIDFSLYDEDANGYITPSELNVVFVLSGYEDAYEGRHVPNGVWAHQSSFSEANSSKADGVVLFEATHHGKYAVFGEMQDINKPHMATVGIIAHELGHALFDLPDLYNTWGSRGGIGYFGLMGAGAWTQKDENEFPGNTPTHFCAWSKTYIGWVTPRELNNTATTLTQTASSDYDVIKIPVSSNHYYLLENRNNAGYDRGLRKTGNGFVGGVAIWYINQRKLTVDNFTTNTVNVDTSDKGVDLVEATEPILDFIPQSGGSYKALFYNPNRTTFGEKITDISQSGSVMNLTIH